MTEDRGQKADKRGQKTELRCQRWGIEHGAWGIEKRKLGSWEVRKRGGSRRKTEGFEFGMIEHGAGA